MIEVKHDQGVSAPTKLMETGNIVHLALWSPLLNRTRCGTSFVDGIDGIDGAERTEEPVSCVTCLVKAEVFEIPLQTNGPVINPDGDPVWLKQVFGPPYNRTTDCCHAEDPCDWHEWKALP